MSPNHKSDRIQLVEKAHVLREKYFREKSPEQQKKLSAQIDEIYVQAEKVLPSFYRHEPISSRYPLAFLISFPRSGNTLAHRMLVALFESRIYQAFPGTGPFTFSKMLYDPEEPRTRIVKDHIFRSEYLWDKSIVIVRDGRDASLSLAHYTYEQGQHKFLRHGQLADFLRFTVENYIYGDWVQNVRRALNARQLGANVRIVRYEELISDDASVLDMVRFIDPNSSISLERIGQVRQEVEASRKEIAHPSWGYRKTYGSDSYLEEWSKNRTQSNWRSAFDAKAARYFHEMGGTEILMQLGYESDPDWWQGIK